MDLMLIPMYMIIRCLWREIVGHVLIAVCTARYMDEKNAR